MNLSAIYWCIRKGFPLRSLLTCDLCYYKLPSSTVIPHPYGITVANGAEVGEDVFISPNVTIGVKEIWFDREWKTTSKAPIIGDGVFIGAGAIILGDITVIDDCIIGANSVVVTSFLEPGTVIAGNPARKIK